MGSSRLLLVIDAKANISHWMGIGDLSEQETWVTGMCEGTTDMEALYWHCTETHTAIKITSFMRSPWLLDQDTASSHSACATAAR